MDFKLVLLLSIMLCSPELRVGTWMKSTKVPRLRRGTQLDIGEGKNNEGC